MGRQRTPNKIRCQVLQESQCKNHSVIGESPQDQSSYNIGDALISLGCGGMYIIIFRCASCGSLTLSVFLIDWGTSGISDISCSLAKNSKSSKAVGGGWQDKEVDNVKGF